MNTENLPPLKKVDCCPKLVRMLLETKAFQTRNVFRPQKNVFEEIVIVHNDVRDMKQAFMFCPFCGNRLLENRPYSIGLHITP